MAEMLILGMDAAKSDAGGIMVLRSRSCRKVIVALLGEYVLDVSKSRFLMGNSFKLTNNVVRKILENYED